MEDILEKKEPDGASEEEAAARDTTDEEPADEAAEAEQKKAEARRAIADEIYSYAKIVLICCVIALTIRFVTPIIIVDGVSMDSTLYHKEFCIGCTFLTPKRGQIVTFKNQDQTQNRIFIKRVIGTPGDTIAVRDHVVYLNGERLEEDYAHFYEDQGSKDYYHDIEEFTLEQDQYFVCGDNRYNSKDSRVFGPIRKKDIRAVILVPIDARPLINGIKQLGSKN